MSIAEMKSVQRNSNLFLYGAVISVNTVSLYGGSTFSWTSPVISKLRSTDPNINPLARPITLFEETWLSSSFMLGNLFGALISIVVANKIGRKKTLVLFNTCILLSFGSFLFISNITWYLIGRFIMGLGTGCVLSTLPSYVAEITEISNRGIAGSIFGVANALGHILNYCIGPFVSFSVLNIIHLIPVIAFYLTFVPFVPESPYYFISRSNDEAAKKSLRKFRSNSLVDKELDSIKSFMSSAETNNCSIRDMFKAEGVQRALFIACGILMCQPFTGFHAVMAYLQQIFEASEGFIPSEYSVLIVGVCPLLSNIGTTILVERIGRKLLLLISSSGAGICLTSLGIYFYLQDSRYNLTAVSWLPVICFIVFIFIVNIGLCSVPWTITGEIFPSNIKTVATGIATICHILAILIMVSIFPYMSISLGMFGSFWAFAVLSLLVVIFIAAVLPETRGKSFAEIQELLKGKNKHEHYV